MITNEVAFIAIAVSDKEQARKFYQETLELTPTSVQMDGAWVEYDLGPTTIGVGCRVRSRGYRCGNRQTQRARRYLRYREDGDTGLLDGAIPRPRREQTGRSQTEVFLTN